MKKEIVMKKHKHKIVSNPHRGYLVTYLLIGRGGRVGRRQASGAGNREFDSQLSQTNDL